MQLVSAVVTVLVVLLGVGIEAFPMDLYDDVSDFFDAVSLDEIPQSVRTVADSLCTSPTAKHSCGSAVPRWNYDAKMKDCFKSKAGICDENQHNFPNYKACMKACAIER